MGRIDSRSTARITHPVSPAKWGAPCLHVLPVLVVVDGPVDHQPSDVGTTALDTAFRAAADHDAPLWVVASTNLFAEHATRRELHDGPRLLELLDAVLEPWRRSHPRVDVRRFVSSGDVAEVATAWAPLTQLVVRDPAVSTW